MADDRVPSTVAPVVDAWLRHHDDVDPDLIEGLYLVGSVALGDWRPASDVDIVAFTADPTDGDTVASLRRAHERFRAEVDAPDVDGPVLSWADVSSPPLAAQRPWTVDGEFRFDGDCFVINPVTWYVLARRGIAIRGPANDALEVHLDVADRRSWVRENVDTYWRGVRAEVVTALEREPESLPADVVEWCVLEAARMAYIHDTGDVRSKSAAGEWALDRFPSHAPVIRRALSIRSSQAAATTSVDGSVGGSVAVEAVDALDAMIEHVAGT